MTDPIDKPDKETRRRGDKEAKRPARSPGLPVSLSPCLCFLRKHWFLLLILAGAAVAALWPAGLGWTARLDPSLCGALAVLLSAWGLETRRLRDAALRPQAALWAAAISYGLLPGLAWLAGLLLPDDYRVGLLLMASVPCTLASAVIWTRLAGGDEATALLVILLTNCTSWLTTTAWLVWGAGAEGVSLSAGPMMGRLALVLVLPVAVGQGLRAAGPLRRLATDYRVPLGVVARLLTLAIMLKAALEVRLRLDGDRAELALASLAGVAAACLGLHLAALFAGLWSSRGLGFDRGRQIAVAIAGSQKTLPVSLILFDAYFARDYALAVIPMAFYHVGQLVADTWIADRLAGKRLKEAEMPEDPVV